MVKNDENLRKFLKISKNRASAWNNYFNVGWISCHEINKNGCSDLDRVLVMKQIVNFLKYWEMMKILENLKNLRKILFLRKSIFECLQMDISLGDEVKWWFCSTSSRRKPGWRFTAGSTYWCSSQARPKPTEFIYNMDPFQQLFNL